MKRDKILGLSEVKVDLINYLSVRFIGSLNSTIENQTNQIKFSLDQFLDRIK